MHAQALNEAKASDLMFWASSYNLFVHWSTNRSHPWDKLPKANTAACTLEIGKLRDSDNEVRPFLVSHSAATSASTSRKLQTPSYSKQM